MPGRAIGATLVTMVVAACIAGCTPSHRARGDAPSGARSSPGAVSRPPSVDGGVALGRPPCLVALPAAWKRALRAGRLWRAQRSRGLTGAPSPDGPLMVLQEIVHGNRAHFALVGRNQRVVEDIGTVPHPKGAQFTFPSITDRYVAFVYELTDGSDGRNAQDVWQLYLFDRMRHRLTRVASYPRDEHGQPLQSGWVDPILTDRYLYWLQGAQTGLPWGGSEVEQYDLATGKTRTLYRGLATALGVVGRRVIYVAVKPHASRKSTDPPMVVAAADQVTGRPVTAPPGITAAADGANYFRSSGGTLIWDTSDGALRGWNAEWGRSITLMPGNSSSQTGKLHISGAGYPRIHGRFVAVDERQEDVLDLKTNSFVEVTTHAGGGDLSGSRLAIEQYASAKKPAFGGPYYTDQTVLDLAKLPDLPRCPADGS